jgi:ribosomal protein S18 acetylase RimI-like enzyme
VVEEGGSARGYAMLGERTTESGPTAFVYGIELDAAHRGRGIGRAAMALLEERARVRGLPRIELNVFGGNAPARGLYRSLGYEEIAVYMGKTL